MTESVYARVFVPFTCLYDVTPIIVVEGVAGQWVPLERRTTFQIPERPVLEARRRRSANKKSQM